MDASAAAPPPILEATGLCKSFFGVRVLHEVGFSLRPGQVLGLVGENGSGKSTTMNILGGVHQMDAGRMTLDGADYRPRNPRDAEARGIAFIHQELNLFRNLSVAENLFIGGFPRRGGRSPLIDRGAVQRSTKTLLAAVDLDVPPATPVSRLSQGERQLVEIAKAIGSEAKVVIFDEPTTSLTTRETERLFDIIARLRAQNIGVIYISHILADVLRLCDDIVVLRDGHMVATAPRQKMRDRGHDRAHGGSHHRPALSSPHGRAVHRASAGGAWGQPARYGARHFLRAAPGRSAGRLRPDGGGAVGAGAHPVRTRPV